MPADKPTAKNERPDTNRGGTPPPGREARRRLDQAAIAGLPAWKLQDAKARFSEVVRRARDQGPQRVTYRGTDAVVVVAAGDFKRLLPAERPRQSLTAFLRAGALGEIDTARSPDRGRDVEL